MIEDGPARTHRRALLAGGAAAVLLGSTVEAADDFAALEARARAPADVCALVVKTFATGAA